MCQEIEQGLRSVLSSGANSAQQQPLLSQPLWGLLTWSCSSRVQVSSRMATSLSAFSLHQRYPAGSCGARASVCALPLGVLPKPATEGTGLGAAPTPQKQQQLLLHCRRRQAGHHIGDERTWFAGKQPSPAHLPKQQQLLVG